MNTIDKKIGIFDRQQEKEGGAKEIERKFLVKVLPEDLKQYPHKQIVQGYLAIAEDGTEVRLRQKGDKYFQTVKTGGGKTRGELEVEISPEQFEVLWPAAAGRRLEKIRYQIPYKDKIIELDIYQGKLQGLVTAEVEFNSEEESQEFKPPEWLGREVTEEKEFKNQNLVKKEEQMNIPEFELKPGVEKLAEMIEEKISHTEGPVIVEIAGGSASGKTSAVAKEIKERFGEEAIILSMDDYYRGKKFMEEQTQKGNELNWDQPEALNLGLLKEHFARLKQGQEIEKPIYNMRLSEPDGVEKVQPKKVVIVEGLFALNDIVKDEGDIKVFVDIGVHGRILRRLLRDIQRTGQKPADILKYFSQVVQPMHDEYVEATKQNADLIIKNEYSPEVEAEWSGMHEVQLKFKGTISEETLRKLGAERLSSTVQIDNYYNPRDRNLIKTGEILRIREEGDRRILTYKGLKIEGKFRERPKFEFEIDEKTEKAFLGIYGDKVKIIQKQRTLYQLDGVIFSLDKVFKIEGGRKVKLGNFIEIRATDKTVEPDKIKAVIKKLGFSEAEGIKKSYFEM